MHNWWCHREVRCTGWCELWKERARWSRLRYHHGQRPSKAEPSGDCRVTVEGGTWRWELGLARETGVPDYETLTGLSQPKAMSLAFFHFLLFHWEQGAVWSVSPSLWKVKGRHEDDLSAQGRRTLTEGWRRATGLLWFVVLIGKDWFISPKGRKQCWQPLLSPFPTPLQNLPLTPKWNEMNAS